MTDLNNDIAVLKKMCADVGMDVSGIVKLPGAGSGRRYYRILSSGEGLMCENDVLTGSQSVRSIIGVAGDNRNDCTAFVSLSDSFANAGISVPRVLAVSADGMHYLQEDLGTVSLFDMIPHGGDPIPSEVERIIKECIEGLVRMQLCPPNVWEQGVVYKPFDRRQVMWDLNYFKYEYLRPASVDFDEDALEDDFERFADGLCAYGFDTNGFMFRDFQSRNVMICNGKPYFIDFQGGRKGPGIYDAVSFLWQAKAGFSDDFRSKMLDYYFEMRHVLAGENRDHVRERKLTYDFALFRTLQVLGAYGLRGLVERKAHFIESIPPALRNLRSLLSSGAADDYPELKRVCREICNDARFKENEIGALHIGALHIKVFSFSYKKGYPADYTGNGGGFMFDCRGMHNPGRYQEYKSLTGRDRAVIDFLEERGEVQEFVRKAVDIVSPSVETYIRRGFSNLQIGFGCTGGQHRSVYCAEHVASILADKYPEATVTLIHREHPSN